MLHFNKIPWWGALLISLVVGFLAGLIVKFFVNPSIKRKIEREKLEALSHLLSESNREDTSESDAKDDKTPKTTEVEKQLLFKDVHGTEE